MQTCPGSRIPIAAVAALAIALIATACRGDDARSPTPTSTATAVDTPAPTATTPGPSPTPDTSRPFWYRPYLDADRAKPLFDGTLAGIRIGNGVDGPSYQCQSETTLAGIDAADGTPADVTPDYLPHDTLLSLGTAYV